MKDPIYKRSGGLRTLFSFTFVFATLSVQSNVIAQTTEEKHPPTGAPPPSITASIKQLPADKRAEVIRRLMALGVSIDVPEFWTEVSELRLALSAINKFGEPINDEKLDSLERLTRISPLSEHQLAASALLYRYNRPSGRTYLANILKAKNLKSQNGQVDREIVAAVFVLNRDEEMLPDVLRLLASYSDLETVELASALGQWKRADIATALFKALKNAPNNTNIAVAVAKQKVVGSYPLLQSIFRSTPSNEVEAYIALIGALASFDGPESTEYMTLLTKVLITPDVNSSHLYAIAALEGNSSTKAKTVLGQLINTYIEDQDNLPANVQDSIIKSDRGKFAVAAAESLAYSQDPNNVELFHKLLKRLAEKKAPLALQLRIANILMATKTKENDFIVGQLLGDIWLQKLVYTRDLRKLPAFLIPSGAV